MIGSGDRTICSSAGCHLAATQRIEWRNPRIHTGERSKVWLACDTHVTTLSAFLAARAFPLQVQPFAPAG